MNGICPDQPAITPVETDGSSGNARLGPVQERFRMVLQTPERASRAFRLTQFLMRFKDESERLRFRQDSATFIGNAGLSDYEVELLLTNNYVAMHEYGVPMVAIGKLHVTQGIPMTAVTEHIREHSPAFED